MYIPTWILILAIVGVTFYYFSKRRKNSHGQEITVQDDKLEEVKTDWLHDENWKETMLLHLAKYPQRTGKKMPTYDEILKLEKDEFEAWLFVRAEPDHEKEMLAEMIDHEERTHSFEKRKREGASDFTKLIFEVFKRERNVEVVDVLKRLSKTANELGCKDEHEGKGDVVKSAIWDKATSDYFGLGEKMKKDRNY